MMAEYGLSQESKADVQSHLISNYRDALKKGEKSAAKSCLLAARYFSANDLNVACEIYIIAKSDGDVKEAARCYANIFVNLISSLGRNQQKQVAHDLFMVVDQMKEENRLLLNELKSHFLRLRSPPDTKTLADQRQQAIALDNNGITKYVTPGKLSPEDDRKAVVEIPSQAPGKNSVFYQKLFGHLPDAIKKNIIEHSIENCDNPFEKCKLIMLMLSIFKDNASFYAQRLVKTLTELGNAPENGNNVLLSGPGTTTASTYARCLLVLDAIPLVLEVCSSDNLGIELSVLFEKALSFYAEHYLELAASEYETKNMHEGVKRCIAGRILCTERNSAAETAVEAYLKETLDLLSEKFIASLERTDNHEKFAYLRLKVSSVNVHDGSALREIVDLIHSLNLDSEVPEDIVSADPPKDESNLTSTPSRSRGRPKKAQQANAATDEATRQQLRLKLKQINLMFYLLVEYLFTKCSTYLRGTRSRILMNFEVPVWSKLTDSEPSSKTSSQRSSRSKSGQLQTKPSPAKRFKGSSQPTSDDSFGSDKIEDDDEDVKDSPLYSEYSKRMDESIIKALAEAHECLDFLNSNCGMFTKLWRKFLATNNSESFNWYRRLRSDSLLMSARHQEFVEMVAAIARDKQAHLDSIVKQAGPNAVALAVMTKNATTQVTDLRNLVQLVACHLQTSDAKASLMKMNELLKQMKQCGILKNDTDANQMDEYKVLVNHATVSKLGFLFFDSRSLLRYCTSLLWTWLKNQASDLNSASDTDIGHLIVLSQVDWPKKFRVYNQCVDHLRATKPKSTTPQGASNSAKFTYHDFFNYVHNPSVIEDFMALLSAGYTLDIKGADSSRSGNAATRSSKAITTRGVNKTFKEDLKTAIVTQMKSSTTTTQPELIADFMRSSLIPHLALTF